MTEFPHPVYERTVLRPGYADAWRCWLRPMWACHQAHTLVLAEEGIISPENARALLRAIQALQDADPQALDYRPGTEDLFFRTEAAIIEQVGPDLGGNLQLARSRNDLGQALARMDFREHLLDLCGAGVTLREAVLALARKHLHTLMPGYTHTQPAQPTTLAHYLAGVLSTLAHDQSLLQAAYQRVNLSPLGAAAFTGTGFPLDRERLAQLLGFDGVLASTHHAIAASDHLVAMAHGIQAWAVDLGRVTRDLLFLATAEVGGLRIHPSFLQISSIMPQKRNPVVLEHLRARLSRALGLAGTVVVQCHNIPYGDTQDIEDEILPPVHGALAALEESLALYTAVLETVEVDRERLARQAGAAFTTATELADTLVRTAGLPFRTAHQVVAHLVQQALAQGKAAQDLTLADLQAAARAVVGQEVSLDATAFRQALDPWHFVAVRQGLGGAAPEATAPLLDALAEELEADRRWHSQARERLERSDALRRDAVQAWL